MYNFCTNSTEYVMGGLYGLTQTVKDSTSSAVDYATYTMYKISKMDPVYEFYSSYAYNLKNCVSSVANYASETTHKITSMDPVMELYCLKESAKERIFGRTDPYPWHLLLEYRPKKHKVEEPYSGLEGSANQRAAQSLKNRISNSLGKNIMYGTIEIERGFYKVLEGLEGNKVADYYTDRYKNIFMNYKETETLHIFKWQCTYIKK